MTDLSTSTEEETITVKWMAPQEYKSSYRYNVTWQSEDGTSGNEIVQSNSTVIGGLVPGTSYNFTVTTETSDGTQGASQRIHNCTSMVTIEQFVLYKHTFSNKFVMVIRIL